MDNEPVNILKKFRAFVVEKNINPRIRNEQENLLDNRKTGQ
jgi:hypothetical protein